MTLSGKETASIGVLAIVVVIAVNLIVAYPLMLLWNFVIPGLFSGPPITYWLSVGLLFLVGILGGMFR